MNTISRRTFVAAMGAAAVLQPGGPPAAGVPAQLNRGSRPGSIYEFFSAEEARFVEAACARLIPPDRDGPGVAGTHVARYLDEQLSGPWGLGHRPYRLGPWQPGTGASVSLSSSPAMGFRTALRAITREFETRGTRFDALDPAEQECFLRGLAGGITLLDGIPAAAFLELLLSMTVEGFFSRSAQAPQRRVLAWPLKGFPGSYFRAADAAEDRGAKNRAATSQSRR